jgi:tripartite-type tricarboxylate transporter receptor subunit TctC
MSQNMGQPILVENRPGASSTIAAQYVTQQAAPDGYTVMSAEQGVLVFNAAMFAKLPYDPSKDFAPVSNLIKAPLVLVVNSSFAATDLKSLVEMAKKDPGKINYGSPGRGIPHHLAMEALKAKAGIDVTDVQYKGIGPVVQGIIANEVSVAVVDTVVVLPHLKSGKLRALGTFSAKRLSVTPDVPTLGELGYADLEIAPIVGLVAPAKTPREVIARLNAEAHKAVRDPEVNGKLTGLGLEIDLTTPEQFAAFLDAEGKRWMPLIRKLNIKLD